ncbi:hypothetical protein [Humisphaera borealis]|uniref:Molecular chaperone DnaJ n=1 Tax=Humisphaera borealis TaxID=2807512 RepID=A0A7M2WRW9_9BACT|nr:hypothetical protein [Humisphaera borealis]QOV87912.1 hypothetical protein IPV69_16760 [Humisphaera borealis]
MTGTVRVARVAVIGLLLACWATAAGPTSAPITVKKLDGTSVTGEMLSADHDRLILLPTGKKDGVSLDWKDVVSVSNGLNRQHAIPMWKAKFQDRLCGACTGDRTIAHDVCEGKGIDPEKRKECVACKGVGAVGKCTNAKCDKGKVDCPGACLKRSVGTWVMKDGQWMREWRLAKGRIQWKTENHLGELFEVTNEGYVSKGDCPICTRTSKVDCSTCFGKGQLQCKPCRGVGFTGPACTGCKDGRIACADCKGKGLQASN